MADVDHFQKTNNGKYLFYDDTVDTRTVPGMAKHAPLQWQVP